MVQSRVCAFKFSSHAKKPAASQPSPTRASFRPQHTQLQSPAPHRLHITHRVRQSADSHPSPRLRARFDRSPRTRDSLSSGPDSALHLATSSSIDRPVNRLFHHAVSVRHVTNKLFSS